MIICPEYLNEWVKAPLINGCIKLLLIIEKHVLNSSIMGETQASPSNKITQNRKIFDENKKKINLLISLPNQFV